MNQIRGLDERYIHRVIARIGEAGQVDARNRDLIRQGIRPDPAEAAPSQSRLYNALHLLSRARKQAVSSAFCHRLIAQTK